MTTQKQFFWPKEPRSTDNHSISNRSLSLTPTKAWNPSNFSQRTLWLCP